MQYFFGNGDAFLLQLA